MDFHSPIPSRCAKSQSGWISVVLESLNISKSRSGEGDDGVSEGAVRQRLCPHVDPELARPNGLRKVRIHQLGGLLFTDGLPCFAGRVFGFVLRCHAL